MSQKMTYNVLITRKKNTKKVKVCPKIVKNNSIKYSYIEQKYERDLVQVHSKFDLKNTD